MTKNDLEYVGINRSDKDTPKLVWISFGITRSTRINKKAAEVLIANGIPHEG